MAGFVNVCGPVVANTAYVNGQLVARDVAATLPEITPVTTDLSAMGTMSMPVWHLLENMELEITKIGVDLGFRAMISPDSMPLELRWVQTVTDANGKTKNAGCKAFIRGAANKIPGIELAVGEPTENECAFMVTRYQLVVDGVEMFLVDRLAGILRIGGKDYGGGVENLL